MHRRSVWEKSLSCTRWCISAPCHAPDGAKCTAGQMAFLETNAPSCPFRRTGAFPGITSVQPMHQMVQNAPQVNMGKEPSMHHLVRFCTIDAPFGARRTAGQRAFLAIYAPFGAFWCMRASDLGFYDGADLHQMVRPCTKTARLSDKSFRRSGFSACRKSQFRQLRCRTALTCKGSGALARTGTGMLRRPVLHCGKSRERDHPSLARFSMVLNRPARFAARAAFARRRRESTIRTA